MTATAQTSPRRLPHAGWTDLAADARPQLFVVVDTEEEFDWNAPFNRAQTSVSAMQHVGRGQSIFERFGVVPTYVIDYPVATQPAGYEPLLDAAAASRCEIGAHLHPWVNPPHSEAVSGLHSFTCNLLPSLQREKIATLAHAIEERFGTRPRVFKAGRYGIDAVTVGILADLGFAVDTSLNPRMDFSAAQGPDFSAHDARPFLLSPGLLEVPCTTDYVGWLGGLRPAVHRAASRPALAPIRAVGVLSRLGMVNRIMLSPEGNTLHEMQALTRALVRRGLRTFTLSFHSPSLAVGHTPYVRSQRDLDTLLSTIERFCEFFLHEMNGVATPLRHFSGRVLPASGQPS